MNRYPPISEHGPIGDLQTAALVSTGGTVDWLCLPRFDSPSVFASLLDADRGGRFRISPQDTNYAAMNLDFQLDHGPGWVDLAAGALRGATGTKASMGWPRSWTESLRG
jgi:Trehalase-like, N-terminal